MISEAKISYCRDLMVAARLMQMAIRDDSYNGDYKFSFCDPATGTSITGAPSPERDVAIYSACQMLNNYLALPHETKNDTEPGAVPDSGEADDGRKPAPTDEHDASSA